MPQRQQLLLLLSSFFVGALGWSFGRRIFGSSALLLGTLSGEETPLSAVDNSNTVVVRKNLYDKPLGGTNPHTGEIEFGTTERLRYGLWEHTKGKSIQENDDEVFVVLRGRGKIILDDKTTLELEPGTVGRLLKGQGRRWEITEDFRKVWITSKEDGVL